MTVPDEGWNPSQAVFRMLDAMSKIIAGGARVPPSQLMPDGTIADYPEGYVPPESEALFSDPVTQRTRMEADTSPQRSDASMAWGNFSNGKIPLDKLVSLSGPNKGKLLSPSAARSFEQMFRAAQAAGVNLRVSDAYRTYETQAAARASFDRDHTNLAGNWVPSIAPAGRSNHGWGKAVDVAQNQAVLGWMAQNGRRFGWRVLESEPWHWEYVGTGTGGH